jgi:septal ring factor EnvC (AmiA/AmiB activator)
MGSPADLTLGTSQAPSTNATTNTATTTVLSKSSPSSFVGERLQRMRKLEEYLQSLEDERRKIEAFKRELPLCMQLLDESKLCPTTPRKT